MLPIEPPTRLDLALLRALLEQGTLRAAAKVVNAPQQVAVRRIAHLQRRLGVALVESSSDGDRLTQSGWMLLSAGGALLHTVEYLLAAMRDGPCGRAAAMLPTLRLAAFGRNWCGLADDLAVRAPGMLLNLITAMPSEGLALFERHQTDAAYIWAAPGAPAELERPAESMVVIDEPLWVALKADHRCASQSAVSLSELADETWIVGAAAECRDVLDYACRDLIDPSETLLAGSAPQMRSMVGHGLGVALTSPLVDGPREGARLVVRPLRDARSRRLTLITDPRVISAGLARMLVASLRECYADRARRRNPSYGQSEPVRRLTEESPAGGAVKDEMFAGLTFGVGEMWDDPTAQGPEPEDIYVLRVIKECGSLNRAAPVLLITQPALTRRVGRLERRLGLSLLVRGRRGTVLTPGARQLLDGVRDAEIAFRSVLMDFYDGGRGLVRASA